MKWVKVVKFSAKDKIIYLSFLPVVDEKIQGYFERDEFYDYNTQFHQFYDFHAIYGDIIGETSDIDLKSQFLDVFNSPSSLNLEAKKIVVIIPQVASTVAICGSECRVEGLELALTRIDNYLLERIS